MNLLGRAIIVLFLCAVLANAVTTRAGKWFDKVLIMVPPSHWACYRCCICA